MSKLSGLGMTLSVDDSAGTPQDITNDVKSLSVKTSRGEQDVTGLDKSALERLMLLGDAEVSISGTFNPTVSHAVFKNIGTLAANQVGRTVTIGYPGSVGLEMEMVFTDYNLERGDDGALTYTTTGKLSDGTVPAFT